MASLRCSGRANRLTHRASRLTVGFLASAARTGAAAAAATVAVKARAFLIIFLTLLPAQATTSAVAPRLFPSAVAKKLSILVDGGPGPPGQ
jgi:hypothetical protein